MLKSINNAQKENQMEKMVTTDVVAIAILPANHHPTCVVDRVHAPLHLPDHDMFRDHLRDQGQKLVKKGIREGGIFLEVQAFRLIERLMTLERRTMMASWMEMFNVVYSI